MEERKKERKNESKEERKKERRGTNPLCGTHKTSFLQVQYRKSALLYSDHYKQLFFPFM